MTRLTKAQTPGPLERYVRILEALAAFPEGLTALELEHKLGLPKTTMNRLLHGLSASELVVSKGLRNGRFVIGTRLSRVLQGDSAWVESATKRLLREISAQTGETVFIARRTAGQIRSVAMESNPNAAVAVYIVPGHDLPAHATASGKLLAAMNNDPIPASGPLARFTERTIVSRRELKREHQAIRERGYAVENAEHIAGFSTVAVPITDYSSDEVDYAMGITGLTERILTQGSPRHLAILQKAAPQCAAILFHRGAES